jgi:hypothetical protein
LGCTCGFKKFFFLDLHSSTCACYEKEHD